ncbi:LysE family translocator [Rhizobium sp. CC-YZS058]|uniref:LysE family translocator n=1 Tax=Rhizobium sp. CC-YZS058 TaxID=3042153 RepID=UPI002B051D8B|nr:LysE family translocator [Rhizobium sp. CC-YZS058]MEA3533363.1 LysE family translocator [Rhizobium sp. CC-YZS058]
MTLPFPALPDRFLPFLLAAFLLEVTPGPNMTYLALIAARHGRRSGFSTVAGVALGLGVIGLAAAYGVARLVAASAVLQAVLHAGGVLFMLFLAWEGWTGRGEEAGPSGEGRFLRRGFITNLLNPKAALFFVSILPTFVMPGPSAARDALVLTLTYVGVATGVHAAIVLLAGSFTRFMNQPKREQATRRALSLLLVGVAVWMAWSGGR